MFFQVVTSVLGHIMNMEVDPKYKNWLSCDPIELFACPVSKSVVPVSSEFIMWSFTCTYICRDVKA